MIYIRRTVDKELRDHLDKPEVSLILGPRQSGKTTIMIHLLNDLKREFRPTAYFNLDIIEDRQFFISQHALLNRINFLLGSKRGVIFIDEIQRLENAGLFLKGLYDLESGHKFIVSGSGSLELKANVIEPMTGRKQTFFCLPLSFSEFAAYKLKIPTEQVSLSLEQNPFEQKRLEEEYFTYGGYPKVVLSETHAARVQTLTEIYQSYLEKDIQLLLGVEKDQSFSVLVKVIASQIGQLVNRAELSSTLGLSQKTVEKYIYLLEKTFVITTIKPFFTNVRKEVRKSPKVYFNDLGFLNLAQGRLPETPESVSGHAFENACFLRLGELKSLEPIRYWRSTSGAEVDFVLTSPRHGGPVPVEVKLSPGKIGSLGKSLISFLKCYKPKLAFIFNRDQKAKLEKLGSSVEYLPYYNLPRI